MTEPENHQESNDQAKDFLADPSDAIDTHQTINEGFETVAVPGPVTATAALSSAVVNQQVLEVDANQFLTCRGILRTGFPLMIGTGIGAIQQSLDRLFLSYLNSEALAACFPAILTHYLIICFFIAAASYVGTFVSQHYGAKEWHLVGGMTWPALFLTFIGSVFALACVPFLPFLFELYKVEPLVHTYMVDLGTWYCYGSCPAILLAVWSAFFSGIGRVRLVMFLSVAVVSLNILFNYMLIFGNWGMPAYGVVGAAIGTVLAQAIIASVYTFIFFGKKMRARFHTLSQWRIGYQRMYAFLRYSAPHGIREIFEVCSWQLMFLTVAHFGTIALAANNIVMGWYFMFFAPLLGMIQSIGIGVGHMVGAGRYDDVPRIMNLHLLLGIGYALLWLLAYVCFGYYLIDPFIGELGDAAEWQAIRELSQVVLILGGVWGVVDATQLLLRAGVNAAGDVWWTFTVTPLVYLVTLILPCAGLIYWASLGETELFGYSLIVVTWIVACLSLVTLTFVFAYRYRSGAWRLASVRH